MPSRNEILNLVFQAIRNWLSTHRFNDARIVVTEWSDSRNSECTGRVVATWTNSQSGFQRIRLPEREAILNQNQGWTWPVIQTDFHITPDLSHVIFDLADNPMSGAGGRFAVPENGEFLQFDSWDWIS